MNHEKTIHFHLDSVGELTEIFALKAGDEIDIDGKPVIITENTMLTDGVLSYREIRGNIVVDDALSNEL